MHILYLAQYYTPPDGSGGSRVTGMAKRFVEAGHRVTLLTSSAFFPAHYGLKDPVSTLTIDGYEVRAVLVPYSNKQSYARRVWAFVEFAWRAIREARRIEGVDLVFATSTPLTIAIPAIAAKRKYGVPLVFEVRDLWPEVPIALGVLKGPVAQAAARWLERTAYRASDRIIALSPGMKAGVVRVDGDESKVTVVPNSSDTELFRVSDDAGKRFLAAHPELAGGPLVVYAGTHGKVNGVSWLVDVAAEALKRAPDVRFASFGDGMEKPLVEARAREKGVLGKNFHMYPPIPKKRMPELLNACALSVSVVIDVPELWNNSANKVFDTFAASRPMLVNHEGWLADVLRETGAGVVAPPLDHAKAAELIVAFLGDPARVAAARAAAAKLADDDFNRDKLFEKVKGVLAAARGR